MTDAHTAAGGGAFPGLVSSFTVARDGTLTPLGAPVANDGGAACWIELSRDGRFAFVVNTGSKTVSSYSVGAGGSLTFLDSVGGVGAGAEDARLSPDGSTLWVVGSGTDTVTGFAVHGGTLTPLASIAGPAGQSPPASSSTRHDRGGGARETRCAASAATSSWCVAPGRARPHAPWHPRRSNAREVPAPG